VADDAIRLDKWLWYTRLAPTRGAARILCEARHIRVDGRVIDRAAAIVRVGQVVTMPGPDGGARVVRVEMIPPRRGPYVEAQRAYAELGARRPLTDAARRD
jgi:ribosome-associated heat shock protein Hsp15